VAAAACGTAWNIVVFEQVRILRRVKILRLACGKFFAHNVREEFFAEKILESAPKWCKPYHRVEACGVTERFAALSTRLSTVVLKT
jgi:hypothetical protein